MIQESGAQLLAIRALSVALAFLIWVTVTLERRGELYLSVPVAVEHLPAGLALAEVPPAAVEVKLAGPRVALWKNKWWGDAVCRLDLSRAGVGTTTFSSAETLALDPEVKVVSAQPGAIAVKLKRSPEK